MVSARDIKSLQIAVWKVCISNCIIVPDDYALLLLMCVQLRNRRQLRTPARVRDCHFPDLRGQCDFATIDAHVTD
jgi:hypothetical protein